MKSKTSWIQPSNSFPKLWLRRRRDDFLPLVLAAYTRVFRRITSFLENPSLLSNVIPGSPRTSSHCLKVRVKALKVIRVAICDNSVLSEINVSVVMHASICVRFLGQSSGHTIRQSKTCKAMAKCVLKVDISPRPRCQDPSGAKTKPSGRRHTSLRISSARSRSAAPRVLRAGILKSGIMLSDYKMLTMVTMGTIYKRPRRTYRRSSDSEMRDIPDSHCGCALWDNKHAQGCKHDSGLSYSCRFCDDQRKEADALRKERVQEEIDWHKAKVKAYSEILKTILEEAQVPDEKSDECDGSQEDGHQASGLRSGPARLHRDSSNGC